MENIEIQEIIFIENKLSMNLGVDMSELAIEEISGWETSRWETSGWDSAKWDHTPLRIKHSEIDLSNFEVPL